MSKKKVYLASSLGFSESGSYYMYMHLIPLLSSWGLEVVNPWDLVDLKEFLSGLDQISDYEERKSSWKEMNETLAQKNTLAISSCDLVMAILDGPDIDSGVSAEIGYAYASNKKVLGLRTDLRIISDNLGSPINLQVEYFIKSSGGEVFTDIDSLQEYFK